MNSDEIKQLKTFIRQRISELESLINEADNQTAQSDSTNHTMPPMSVESMVNSNTGKSLIRLKRNLEWLASEDTGYCGECGCEIPFKRLKAVPVTRLCVGCAE